MKYMETGRFDQHPLMRLTLGLTLLFLLGFWISNFGLYFSKMGLSPDSVIRYYRGSEEMFIPPRSALSLIETTHTHLPMMGILILFLTHLVIFAPFANNLKIGIILTAFLSALSSETASWLVRFVHPNFAYLKIASFLIFQSVLGFLLVVLALFLWEARRRAHTQGLDW